MFFGGDKQGGSFVYFDPNSEIFSYILIYLGRYTRKDLLRQGILYKQASLQIAGTLITKLCLSKLCRLGHPDSKT